MSVLSERQFTFDVDFSNHDALKRGEVVQGTHRVSVLAKDHVEGQLIATQMVSARGKTPTGARRVV